MIEELLQDIDASLANGQQLLADIAARREELDQLAARATDWLSHLKGIESSLNEINSSPFAAIARKAGRDEPRTVSRRRRPS